MDIQFCIVYRRTPRAPDCTVLSWFTGTDFGTPACTHAEFLVKTGQEQAQIHDTALGRVISCIEVTNNGSPLARRVYCVGGCGRLLHKKGKLTPRRARDKVSLRSPAYGWSEETNRPIAYLRVAMHCPASDCILAVQRMFRDNGKMLRAENPELEFRRHCAGCGQSDSAAAPFRRCKGCGISAYCSHACAVQDWPLHGPACRKTGQ